MRLRSYGWMGGAWWDASYVRDCHWTRSSLNERSRGAFCPEMDTPHSRTSTLRAVLQQSIVSPLPSTTQCYESALTTVCLRYGKFQRTMQQQSAFVQAKAVHAHLSHLWALCHFRHWLLPPRILRWPKSSGRGEGGGGLQICISRH